MAGEGFADGSGDSRISGSVLDRWIRANGSPELQVEWRNLLKERQLDVVERRANVLLSDLQGEMSLDADTKDALYSEMVRRAEDEYVSLGAGTLPGEETLERWSHDYFSALEPHLTAAQRETLTDWLGGRMAEFWMAESGMMPESP